MNEEIKESLRELGASDAIIEASGGDLAKAISMGSIGRKLVKYGPLFLHDPIGCNFAIPPFNQKEFEIFFQRAGFTVPSEYIDFLVKSNGGDVVNKVWFSLGKGRRQLRTFLSFKSSLLGLPRSWIYNASCKPLYFLEIATDSKGDYIALKLKCRESREESIKFGSIWHIKATGLTNHHFSEDEIVNDLNYSQIAGCFNEFIEKLKCKDELPNWLNGKEIFENR